MDEIANNLCLIAQKEGADAQIVFNDFLDYVLDCLSYERLIQAEGNYHLIFTQLRDENNAFFPVFASLLMLSVEYINKHGVYDFFGNIYEKMFQRGSKAAKLGQFFTPQEIADVCAKVSYEPHDSAVSNEPTCGSGRNILALFAQDKSSVHYYIAEDLDSLSVKMCAINMVIHGMRGCCICHNTLFPDEFIFGYEINEVRYPFPTECYSVREISKNEYIRRSKKWQKQKKNSI